MVKERFNHTSRKTKSKLIVTKNESSVVVTNVKNEPVTKSLKKIFK